jgi:hypothetical protein
MEKIEVAVRLRPLFCNPAENHNTMNFFLDNNDIDLSYIEREML